MFLYTVLDHNYTLLEKKLESCLHIIILGKETDVYRSNVHKLFIFINVYISYRFKVGKMFVNLRGFYE